LIFLFIANYIKINVKMFRPINALGESTSNYEYTSSPIEKLITNIKYLEQLEIILILEQKATMQ